MICGVSSIFPCCNTKTTPPPKLTPSFWLQIHSPVFEQIELPKLHSLNGSTKSVRSPMMLIFCWGGGCMFTWLTIFWVKVCWRKVRFTHTANVTCSCSDGSICYKCGLHYSCTLHLQYVFKSDFLSSAKHSNPDAISDTKTSIFYSPVRVPYFRLNCSNQIAHFRPSEIGVTYCRQANRNLQVVTKPIFCLYFILKSVKWWSTKLKYWSKLGKTFMVHRFLWELHLFPADFSGKMLYSTIFQTKCVQKSYGYPQGRHIIYCL